MERRAGSPSKGRDATQPLRSCPGKTRRRLWSGFNSGLKSTPGFHRVFNLWEEVEEITGLSRSLRPLRKRHCSTQTNHRHSKTVI